MQARDRETGEIFEVTVKESDGRLEFEGEEYDFAEGTILLTDAEGTTRPCHPSVFEDRYEQVS